MASTSSPLSEEQFRCSICLDVFIEPVSIQCGDTFCKTCITKYWDDNFLCQCPLCQKTFVKRPGIFVNIVISEMAAQFRKPGQRRTISIPDPKPARKEKVFCDVCTEKQIKAVKSCLVCLASYCETHLEPHQKAASLKKHKLINPVENLEDRICKKHERLLEVFCRTDQVCVCQICTKTDHKDHNTIPLETKYRERRDEMRTKEAEVQQMILEREQKLQQFEYAIYFSQKEANREIKDRVKVFNALIVSIMRSQAEFIEVVEKKQKAEEKRAEGFIKELKQEITKLKKRNTELEKVSHTEDHLHLLQSFPSLSTPPPTKDWSEVNVHSNVSMGTVRRAVTQLEETLHKEMENLPEVKLKRIKKYAVDVTLDPDTAHPELILSDDGKEVKHGDAWQFLPYHPDRFNKSVCVLGKQSFSSGRFYYEVQVKEKTHWDVGVARQSINMKGSIGVSPKYGFWAIWLRDGDEYKALDNTSVLLFLREKPQVIGVFVDYDGGQVSFYDVEARVHIYSYTDCAFTEGICPYFSPSVNHNGTNAAPLIICPLEHQK